MNSLGIKKSKKDTKVVVAVWRSNSSVVAALMKQEGYNVIGITLKHDESKKKRGKTMLCWSRYN